MYPWPACERRPTKGSGGPALASSLVPPYGCNQADGYPDLFSPAGPSCFSFSTVPAGLGGKALASS